MLQFASDENLNGDIIRGLLLRNPDLDLVCIQDITLQEAEDPEILNWADENERIVLTHDRPVMPDFDYDRLLQGKRMSGLFVISDRMAIG